MKPSSLLILILLAIPAASCSAMNTASPLDDPSLPTPDSGGQAPESGVTPDPAAANLVLKARADLASRLSIPEEQISVSSARAVTWPDSSLGCPQPGMAYAQVLAPGYLILLEAGGEVWEYHADRKSLVFYCENPEAPVPGTPADI